jgi:hypothetical protein
MRALRVSERSPFFLIVNVLLKKDQLGAFEDKMPSLFPAFKNLGFQLLLAGAFEDKPDHVLHVWYMPDPTALLRGMTQLADNVDYTRIDDLIDDESQDLGTAIRQYQDIDKELLLPWQEQRSARIKRAATGGGYDGKTRYMVVNHSLEPGDLAEYSAQYEGRLREFNNRADVGWQVGEGVLRITGELNRVSRVWVVPAGLKIEEAKEKLQTAPGASLVKSERTAIFFLSQTAYEIQFGEIAGS